VGVLFNRFTVNVTPQAAEFNKSTWSPQGVACTQLLCKRGLLLLLPQEAGAAPWLRGLFAYNYSALPSLGLDLSLLPCCCCCCCCYPAAAAATLLLLLLLLLPQVAGAACLRTILCAAQPGLGPEPATLLLLLLLLPCCCCCCCCCCALAAGPVCVQLLGSAQPDPAAWMSLCTHAQYLLLLLAQEAGAAPWLRGLFAYNYSALPSLGLSGSALSGMKAAMPKLISGELHIFLNLFLNCVKFISMVLYSCQACRRAMPSVRQRWPTVHSSAHRDGGQSFPGCADRMLYNAAVDGTAQVADVVAACLCCCRHHTPAVP
jgi:hypothetical protein